MMRQMAVLAAILGAMAFSGCGNSGVSCNIAASNQCTDITWPGVMSPSPACVSPAVKVDACATGAAHTCTFTNTTSFPSTVTYVVNFYTGADFTAAQASCTSASGAWR